MSKPTNADLTAAVTRLTQENAQLRDLLAAVSECADTVPVSAGNDYSAEWLRSTRVLSNIKVLCRLDSNQYGWGGYLAYKAEELRSIAAEPVGYEVHVMTGDTAPAPSGEQQPETEPTLHQQRLQAVRDGSPAVQDGPYAYVRHGG